MTEGLLRSHAPRTLYETVRQAPNSSERNATTRRSPNPRVAFASSQRSFALVRGSASC